MPEVKVRHYRPEDATPLAELYRRSVLVLGPRFYRHEQVAAWASLAPGPDRIQARAVDGRTVLVAVDEADRALAFADLEPDGHIGYFYAAPEAAGTGVADLLLAALEADARERGLVRLYVEASEAARRFLERHGFRTLGRRELRIGGTPIHNYAMDKSL